MKNSFHTWAHNQDRLSLLDPNHGESRIQVGWSFPMPIQTVRLGTQKLACCAQPIVDVKPHHLIMNVPDENMFFLDRFITENTIEIEGPLDACIYGSIKERDKGAVCIHCGAPPKGPLTELCCAHCGAQYPTGTKNYGKQITCPLIRTSSMVKFEMRYTGRVPPNYREDESFDLSITLEGAAKLQRG